MVIVDQEILRKKMRQVNALLARAEHPETPAPEAEESRAKAAKLMAQYRIEESQLAEEHPELSIKPGRRDVDICPSASPYLQTYWRIMCYIAQHAEVRMASEYRLNEEGIHTLVAICVGYESDLSILEMMYTSARMVFGEKLEPQVKRNLSDADNVYRLRKAGIERWKIAQMIWGTPNTEQNPDHKKVTKLYKEACAARGEDPKVIGHGVSVKSYRESYQEEFTTTLWNRLRRARMSAVDAERSGEIVLHNRKESVDEAFYGLFPFLRPAKAAGALEGGKETEAQRRRRMARATREWREADRRRNSAAGRLGADAGADAALAVELDRPTGSDKLYGAPTASPTPLERGK